MGLCDGKKRGHCDGAERKPCYCEADPLNGPLRRCRNRSDDAKSANSLFRIEKMGVDGPTLKNRPPSREKPRHCSLIEGIADPSRPHSRRVNRIYTWPPDARICSDSRFIRGANTCG